MWEGEKKRLYVEKIYKMVKSNKGFGTEGGAGVTQDLFG